MSTSFYVEVLVLDLRFCISEHKCWRVEHKVYFLRDNNYQSYLGLGTEKFKYLSLLSLEYCFVIPAILGFIEHIL